MAPLTRRAFLKVAGLAGLAVSAGCSSTRPSKEGLPAGTAMPPGSLPLAPTRLQITPSGQLFLQSYSTTPSVDTATWRLTVDGLVERPASLSYDEVRAFPKVTSVRTLECIGNPVGGGLIGNPEWSGFAAAGLWERVGIRAQAIRAKLTSADGYQTSVELSWITQPGVLLVYEINGEPLPPAHGYPLRILMPGLYGQKMPKWLTDIEFIDERFLGYWESQGWSDVASVQTNSMMRQPRDLEVLPAGVRPVYGVAFAGLRRITSVEVRVDDGDWIPAVLLQDSSPLVWTQWSFDWGPAPGRHALAVRATDETGFTQTSESGPLLSGAFPEGTDEIHRLVVTVEG